MTDQIPPQPLPTTPRPMHRVTGYAWYALAVFVLVYALNFIDRQVLSILAESVKKDLDLDDAQLGFLYGTAFAVFYALFGIPLGRLADSWYRGRLMAIGLALWSTMTAASGLATGFAGLAVARIGVGIGEASASPAAYSMISDYFPKEKRATALSIYSSGLYIGGGLSLPIGGFVLSEWAERYPVASAAPFGLAPWQAAFMAVGLPGILVAFWVWTLKEPLRGESDGQPSPVVRPNAWREFGKELGAILPPLTLLSVARIPGALKPNLIALASVAIAAFLLWQLTGDGAQWLAYGIGVYAVYSLDPIAQAPRPRDPPPDLGNSGDDPARRRVRQHRLHHLRGQLLDPALRPAHILHRADRRRSDHGRHDRRQGSLDDRRLERRDRRRDRRDPRRISSPTRGASGIRPGGCSSAPRACSCRFPASPGRSPPTISKPSTGWCPTSR